MNATQSKALFTAAINVREMLAPKLAALLQTDERTDDQERRLNTIRALVQAIAEIECAPVKATARKAGKIDQRKVWMALESKAAKAMTAEEKASIGQKTLAHFRNSLHPVSSWTMAVKQHPDQSAINDRLFKERMSYCACGGLASQHEKDEMDNLLQCSHCDECSHFHYDVDGEAKQAA